MDPIFAQKDSYLIGMFIKEGYRNLLRRNAKYANIVVCTLDRVEPCGRSMNFESLNWRVHVSSKFKFKFK